MRKSALERVERSILEAKRRAPTKAGRYLVPSLWLGKPGKPVKVQVEPYDFLLRAVRNARQSKSRTWHGTAFDGGEWSRQAVIYNLFVRTATAFDHDGNGVLDLPVNAHGFRDTGTFLKTIALLPYIKQLGANTIHLLPVTSIGHDGNKGSLGSPYAIRNPYLLDETLSEPVLGNEVNIEFKAFVEAAHRFGFRVVLEFVFRTASKDSDWIPEYPEWFYWIRQEVETRTGSGSDDSRYGSPLFSREELESIHHQVSQHRFDNLLPPHPVYRDMFTPPPPAGRVEKINGRYRGILPDGRHAKIPGAFADWPPDDSQPPWDDVTYLRMYDHADFNYIAYNTIRMYDSRLSQPEHINRPLWEKISGIIPFYQKEFEVDGVMIDMGHALPIDLKKEIIRRAREGNPDFAFWDENFSITRKSREEGYNAVFGYLWWDQHHPAKMKAFIKRCSSDGVPIPFFATPESHNTPRAASRPGGTTFSKWSWVLNCFLPGIPFIHSGFELGETHPINTGLDFSADDLRKLPSEKLPLFSAYAFDWLSKTQFPMFIRKVAEIRRRYRTIVTNDYPESVSILEQQNEAVVTLTRSSTTGRKRLSVLANSDFLQPQKTEIRLESNGKQVRDLLSGRMLPIRKGRITVTLKPGQCVAFES